MSQAGGATVDDQINLDVHAINELQNRGVTPTDDLPKYSYTADIEGNYSKNIFEMFILCDVHKLDFVFNNSILTTVFSLILHR